MFLAIYPKETDFGRPTIFNLPWRSYQVYGAIAYLAGVAILYFSYQVSNSVRLFSLPDGFMAKSHPLVASMLFSFIFVYFTVGLSILVDRRLQSGSVNYEQGRVRDGLSFAGPMIALIVVMQAAIILFRYFTGGSHPFTAGQIVLTSGIYIFVIFLIGYFVPSTAHAHLEATKIILSGRLNTKPSAWSATASA
jgi:hypothetical protein